MSNDDFPSTRGLTDAQVHARQMASRETTLWPDLSRGPVVVRFAAWQLPYHYNVPRMLRDRQRR